jgi:hypothetical protein
MSEVAEEMVEAARAFQTAYWAGSVPDADAFAEAEKLLDADRTLTRALTAYDRFKESEQEYKDALRCAHDALHWLGRVRSYLDGPGHPRTQEEMIHGFYLFAVAECIAELHAQGPETAITIDDVFELAGWDGAHARELVNEGWEKLMAIGFVKDNPGRIIVLKIDRPQQATSRR